MKSVQRFQRRRFKCEKLTDGRTTDAYPWQKLTWPVARWAKNTSAFAQCWYTFKTGFPPILISEFSQSGWLKISSAAVDGLSQYLHNVKWPLAKKNWFFLPIVLALRERVFLHQMHLNGMTLAPSKDLGSRGLQFSWSRIPLKHEWKNEYAGLDINVCPIVRYQWKLTSDK